MASTIDRSSTSASPVTSRLEGNEASQLAEEAATIWQEVRIVLNPVLGVHGTAALFERSLSKAARIHPWLLPHDGLGEAKSLDLSALKRALTQRPPAECRAAAHLHFYAFNELFKTLFGRSLTERLLAPVWSRDTPTPPAQDDPPYQSDHPKGPRQSAA